MLELIALMEKTDKIQELSTDGSPKASAPEIGSRFLFVDIAAMRAKQLRRGALSRVVQGDSDQSKGSKKIERIAMEEVRQGLIDYELVEVAPKL